MGIEDKATDLGKEVEENIKALQVEMKRLERLVSSTRDYIFGLEKSTLYPMKLRLEYLERFVKAIKDFLCPEPPKK